MNGATIVRRAVASVVIVSGAVLFLVFFGPHATPVHADIYAPLARVSGFLAPPPGGGDAVRFGTVLVNGQMFHYSIGRSKLSLDVVLTYYERQFDAPGPDGKPVSSAARLQGEGAGVVAGVRLGMLSHPPDLAARLRNPAAARLSDLGRFHVVSAFEQDGTVFVEFTPDDDVRVSQLLPAGGEDAPGEDLAGVRRPGGLQRLLTIEHGEGPDWSRTLIYRARDGRAAVADFRGALGQAGWTANPYADSPELGHYTDGKRECFLGGAGLGSNSTVILVHRSLSLSNGKR